MLRVRACVICGDPIPAGRRVDRRYCRMSCRSVAYRARKGAKRPPAATCPGAPSAGPPQSRYGVIPSEVLDTLTKYFGQHQDSLITESPAAQRRATEAEPTNLPTPQLEDLQRALNAQRQHASQLESLAASRNRDVTEHQEKRAATEAHATQLEQQLRESEQRRQSAQIQATARGRELEETQKHFNSLKARAAQDHAAASQQLAALKAERDQLQAESALYRQRTERDEADPIYDKTSAQATQMLRTLLETQAKPAVLHAHMQHFGVVLRRAARWFARQFIRALLDSERPVDVSVWATTAAADLRRQSQQDPVPFPAGMPEWTAANPELVVQLALCVAGSTSAQILGTMPAVFRSAPQAPAAPPHVFQDAESAPASPATVAPRSYPVDSVPHPPSTHSRPAPAQRPMGAEAVPAPSREKDPPVD